MIPLLFIYLIAFLAFFLGAILHPVAALWTLGGIALNQLIGSGVMAAMDDEDKRLFKWATSCPIPGGFTITVQTWPVWLWVWWRDRQSA